MEQDGPERESACAASVPPAARPPFVAMLLLTCLSKERVIFDQDAQKRPREFQVMFEHDESESIQEAFLLRNRSRQPRSFIHSHLFSSLDELAKRVRALQPTVLHYNGHGTVGGISVFGASICSPEVCGCFESLRVPMDVAVFNCCSSDALAEMFVSDNLAKYAIGTVGRLTDIDAGRFAATFWQEYLGGVPVLESFGRAVSSLADAESTFVIYGPDVPAAAPASHRVGADDEWVSLRGRLKGCTAATILRELDVFSPYAQFLSRQNQFDYYSLAGKAHSCDVTETGLNGINSAISNYKKALKVAVEERDLACTEIEIAKLLRSKVSRGHVSKDDLFSAIDLYKSSLGRSHGDPALVFAARVDCGNCYMELVEHSKSSRSVTRGWREKAKESYTSAIADGNRPPSELVTAKTNLATAYLAGETDPGEILRGVGLLEDIIKDHSSIESSHPSEWANVHLNLAIAYTLDTFGTTRLDDAKGHFNAALKILSERHYPNQWATAQSRLGSLLVTEYCRKPDKRPETIEKAIECFSAAMRVNTRSAAPALWADLCSRLGEAYSYCNKSLSLQDILNSITFFEMAHSYFTPTTNPAEYERIKHNLKILYMRAHEIRVRKRTRSLL